MASPEGAREPTWYELADAVWLMSVMGPASDVGAEEPEPFVPPPLPLPSDPKRQSNPEQTQANWRGWEHRSQASPVVMSKVRAGDEAGAARRVETLYVPPLPGAAGIVRALRPLHRQVLSRRDDDVVLDEVATAERAVQDGLWLPMTTAATERWLDLTLVIDAGPSMALWRSTIAAFESLLMQLGTFRTIQRRLLDLSSPAGPILRGGTPSASPRGPAQLVDPSGRRVVLVLTDGVSGGWQSQSLSAMLARFASSMPTAIVHLLPQSLWRSNGLRLHRARLRPRGRLVPNSRWSAVLPDDWLESDFASPAHRSGVPVPVLELDERWFRALARLLTGPSDPVDVPVMLVHEAAAPQEEDDAPRSPREEVSRFLAAVSPTAFRLATLLAAVPVSLETARLIQTEVVPESGAEHLAEVLGSDLFRPEPHAHVDTPWHSVTFTVRPEVREELLSSARRSETARVVRIATNFSSTGTWGSVLALDFPDSAPDPEVSGEIAIERIVLQALSGPYLSRVDRISALEAQEDREVRREFRPTGGPQIWGAVPQRNRYFVGRETSLAELRMRLAAGGITAILPSQPFGIGGIGKTQLVTEYIYRYLRDYDLVWWIEASQATQIRASLTELAQALDLPGGEVANTAVPAVLEALRLGRPFRRWLLVFDAATSPEILRAFFPANGPGQIVVISRDSQWSGENALEVGPFSRNESRERFRTHGLKIPDEDGDRIADTLRDLPLAIEQAAMWLAETGMPVEDYLRLFEEKRAEIQATTEQAQDEIVIAAGWSVAFDALRDSNPDAHQLLQVCAFFSAKPIPRGLLTDVSADAIRDIRRYGLARVDYRNDTLQLHRLVRMVLRNRMSQKDRDENKHSAHLVLANFDPNDPLAPEQWQRYRDLLPHVYTSDLIDCQFEPAQRLVVNMMTFLYRWGDHDEAISLAERALRLWRTGLGEEHSKTLEVAGKLGYYYWVTGNYARAAELNSRTVEIRQRIDGEDNEATLSAMLAVAIDLRAKGDFGASARLSTRVYHTARTLFGEDHSTTLRFARLLCVSLRLIGEYRQAADLDADTYDRVVRILGEAHPETLSIMSGLIIDRREAGEYLWARNAQEELARRARELHGENSADTLRRLAYLAVARRKAGDHGGALSLSTDVLARFQVRYGPDNFNAIACALGRSIDLRLAGDLQAAKDLGEEVMERYVRSMGDHHPYTNCAIVDLAVTLRLLGQAASAHALDELAYARLEAALGLNHPYTIMCAINLASDTAALGDVENALVLNELALTRAERALGPDHPTTLAARLNRALDLRTLGRDQEAEQFVRDVVMRYRKVLGEQHPATHLARQGVRANCDIDPLPM